MHYQVTIDVMILYRVFLPYLYAKSDVYGALRSHFVLTLSIKLWFAVLCCITGFRELLPTSYLLYDRYIGLERLDVESQDPEDAFQNVEQKKSQSLSQETSE